MFIYISMKWYQRTDCKVSFQFIKTIEYPEYLDDFAEEEKLNLLRSMDFGRIHIPNFTYRIDYNVIKFNIDFIKGCQLCRREVCRCKHCRHDYASYWSQVIYEDLVDNDNPYGFHDIGPEQFICEIDTEKLYLVDFESFQPMTLEEKKQAWRNSQSI